MDSNRRRKEITIPPIRASGKRGQLTDSDAAVVIGGSTPDIVNTPQSSVQASKVRQSVSKVRQSASKVRQSASKGKPKRSRRIYFVPNKVSMSKLKAWKKQYGAKFYLSMISLAIEKYEP